VSLVIPSFEVKAERSAYLDDHTLRHVLRPGLTLALLLLIWEVAVRISGVSPAILPAPTRIFAKFEPLLPLLATNVTQTAIATLIAMTLSCVIGVALAAILIASEFLDDCLYPNLVVLQIIPKIALAPLFVMWLGYAMHSHVVFAIFLSFFPVFIATHTGLRQVDQNALRLCRGLRAPAWRVLLKLRLPYALPYIFSGMKVTSTLAVIGVVVGEFIASQGGLGYLILFASAQQQTDVSMAAIACLCLVGVLIYGAIAATEHIVNRRLGFGDP
jgi:NitT/TauT family transport system permease protein